jgi:hypothetical protein
MAHSVNTRSGSALALSLIGFFARLAGALLFLFFCCDLLYPGIEMWPNNPWTPTSMTTTAPPEPYFLGRPEFRINLLWAMGSVSLLGAIYLAWSKSPADRQFFRANIFVLLVAILCLLLEYFPPELMPRQ